MVKLNLKCPILQDVQNWNMLIHGLFQRIRLPVMHEIKR